MSVLRIIKEIKKLFITEITSKRLIIFLTGLNALLLCLVFYYLYSYIKITPAVRGESTFNVRPLSYLPPDKNVNVQARSVVVLDQSTNIVVYRKNDIFRFSPASSAKIMTAAIALEYYDPHEVLEVRNIKQVEGSAMGLFENEKIRVIDLLYGLLLPSGNDAAYILANNYPGGTEAFVQAMNQKVQDLGLNNTVFVDASGYEDGNYTTAYDLAQIASYAMKNKEFASIVNTKNIVVTDVSGKIVHKLVNLNELLGVDGVNGIKTGFTEEAGGVLVTSIQHNNREYIIVVLKSSDRFLDTREVIDEVIRNIELLRY